jgi:hypothetical protein
MVDLTEAIRRANQVLVEERRSPTVKYSRRLKDRKPEDSFGQTLDLITVFKEPEMLQVIRARRPRQVVEDPNQWAFESINYNLLCALLSQLAVDLRPAFLTTIIGRLATPPGCEKSQKNVQPSWNGLVSEFPLVAEFCVRNGAKDIFLRSVGETHPVQGHAVLLRHLEDMVALNFTVFSESDYDALTTAVSTLARTSSVRLRDIERKMGGHRTLSDNRDMPLYKEIIAAADALREECRKAQYFYLKGSLLEGLNLEVNQDKQAVEGHLKGQGFSEALLECLNQADHLYHGAASGFHLKSAMGHLRSFMERLHAEGLAKLKAPASRPAAIRWGDGLKELQTMGALTKVEEGYASALFTLLSDEGVHPVIAEKEYARLARNVVVEYALLFLTRLEKMGRSMGKIAAGDGATL